MKKISILVLFLAACGLVLTGCAAREQNMRLNKLQADVAELRDQAKLRDMDLDRRLKQARSTLPELHLELDRIKSELQRLTNALETVGQKGPGGSRSLKDHLNIILARLDRLDKTLRLPPLSAPTSGVGETAAITRGGVSRPRIQVRPGETAETPGAVSDLADYKAAEVLYKQQAYLAALEKFQEFVKIFPKSDLTPSAQFYLGECLYHLKKFEEAILEYQKVVKKHPQSPKVPAALAKQAYSFLYTGDKTTAKILFQKVIKEHPKSYWAGIARKKLARLK